MISAWSDYAKARFDDATKRVDEFRNWARQLAGAIGVAVGFELTLVGKLLDLKEPFDHQLRGWALGIIFTAIAAQVVLLLVSLLTGYRGRQLVGPERPMVLADYIAGADDTETKRIVGAYYAQSYDRFHDAAEALAKRVGAATALFCVTLFLLVIGVGLLLQVATSSAYTGAAMSQPTPPPAASPASPAPSAPAASASVPQSAAPVASTAPANPILVTPTAGQPITLGATPTGGQLVTTTPTSGQLMTHEATPQIPPKPAKP